MSSRKRAWIAPALIGLAVAAFAGDGERPAFAALVPDAEAEGAPPLHGATWVVEGADYTARLQLIDDAGRLAYIEHITGLRVDPFASPPGDPPAYISFVLEIQNRGANGLAFNPRKCWLSTNRPKDMQSPINLVDLGFDYRVAEGKLPEAYKRAGPAMFQDGVIIGPEQSRSGLLTYRAVSPRTKWMRVDVVLVLPNGDEVRFAAPYRRPKKPKNKE